MATRVTNERTEFWTREGPTLSQLHFFACYNLYLGPFWAIVAGSCSNVVAQPQMLQTSELKCAKQLNMAIELETNAIAVGEMSNQR